MKNPSETDLQLLEGLLERCEVEVRCEEVTGDGGLVKVRGKWVLFLHSRLKDPDKVEYMLKALRRIGTHTIFIPPRIRHLLCEEGWNE